MPELPEWLTLDAAGTENLSVIAMAVRLVCSLICGGIIAAVYRLTQRREASMSVVLTTTLVLLTILVAMTALVIGNNVARAFSLVGALSIVRFRTVVEDTRDTAFVIFAVVVGMAVGAGHLTICLMGVPLVSLAAGAMNLWGRRQLPKGLPQKLEVRVGIAMPEPQVVIGKLLAQYAHTSRLTAIVTGRQGTAFDLQYVVQLREPSQMLSLVQGVHKLEGVQQVELKEI